MRIVIAAALSLLLLGCQQTSEHHSVASTPQEKYESTELFDTRAKAAIGTITDKIASKCMDGLNSIALLQEFLRSPCMKTTLLRNFDKTGEIKEKCPAEESSGTLPNA